MAITKPDMSIIWAEGGAIVEPSDVKKQTGWSAEVPPHQWENWIQNRQDEYLAHINERGIPAWDGLSTYLASGLSYVQGSDGKIYKSVAASGPATTIQDPTTDVSDTYWTVAFADVGAFLTQATGDARYLQILNNGSDINNAVTFRSNIGAAPLASPTFTGVPAAPTAAVGTNTTQLATTAFVLGAAIGYGQTWQSMAGLRFINVVYTNNTGRPIQVNVSMQGGEGEQGALRVSAPTPTVWIDSSAGGNGAGATEVNAPLSAVIPAGWQYKVEGSSFVSNWAELR